MSEFMLSQTQLEKLVGALVDGATPAQARGISEETLEQLYALGHNLYTSASYADAQIVFQALTLNDPGEYRFWLGLAGCRQALGQYLDAINAYQMAGVASQLKNPEPFLHAANCFLKLGRRDDARSALEGVLNIGAEDPQYESVRTRARALLNLLSGE